MLHIFTFLACGCKKHISFIFHKEKAWLVICFIISLSGVSAQINNSYLCHIARYSSLYLRRVFSFLVRSSLQIKIYFIVRKIELCKTFRNANNFFRNYEKTVVNALQILISLKFFGKISFKILEFLKFICAYYVTRTPTNGSAVYWSRDTDGDICDNDTALPFVGVLVT